MTDVPKPRTLDFSAEAKEIWGDTTEDLERLDELFSPHSFDEFREHPEVMRAVFDEAIPHIEKLSAQMRKVLMTETFGRENPHLSRSPKSDGIDILHRVNDSIGELYPAWKRSDVPFIQALFINFFYYIAISEWYVRLLDHSQNKHAKRGLDALAAAGRILGSTDKMVQLMEVVSSIKEFFQTHHVLSYPVNHLSLSELTAINEKLFKAAETHRQHEIPLSVCHEEDICREALCLTSRPIETNSSRFGYYAAEFSMFDERFESALLAPGLINILEAIPDSALGTQHIAIYGESVILGIERFHGQLHAGMLSSEALKVLLGEQIYEVLRAYLLFRYAQLVCDEDDFVEYFGEFITLMEPPSPKQRSGGVSADAGGSGGALRSTEPPPWQGKLPVRFFPRGHRAELLRRVSEGTPSAHTGHKIRGRRTEAHRRLLPFGWQPTHEAVSKARNEGANLLEVFEMFMEETEDGLRERRYTYVTGHEFGDMSEAVRAVYGHRLTLVAKSEK